MSVALEPIVYWIGDLPLLHGERADEDPQYPEACLCGHSNYLMCPEWLEHGLYGRVFSGRSWS